jgi:hypothetical protein
MLSIKPAEAGGVRKHQLGFTSGYRNLIGIPVKAFEAGVGDPRAIRGKCRTEFDPVVVSKLKGPSIRQKLYIDLSGSEECFGSPDKGSICPSGDSAG